MTRDTLAAASLVIISAIPCAMVPPAGATQPSCETIVAEARRWFGRASDVSMRVSIRDQVPGRPEHVRTLRGYEKRTREGRKLLWHFESPAHLAGMSILAWQSHASDDKLWLYSPMQRRVRQIPPDMRHVRLEGSLVTYQDLIALFRYLDQPGDQSSRGRTECAGATCCVLEIRLPPRHFAHETLRLWLRADTLLPTRLEFRGPEPTKVVQILRAGSVDGHPTIHELEITIAGEPMRTSVALDLVKYDQGLSEGFFSLDRLSRMGQ